MIDDHGVENDKRVRRYLRSNRFRVCSWSVAVLLVASFLVSSHRIWFLYAAAAVSFGAMLPVLWIVPYNRRLEIRSRRDKRFLLFMLVYIALILTGAAYLAASFGSR